MTDPRRPSSVPQPPTPSPAVASERAGASSSAPGRLGVSGRLLLACLRIVPRNALSRLGGRFASIRWPRVLRPMVPRIFGRIVGVEFSEVRDPLESFETLQDFFVRALVEGARTIDPAEDALVSPCDGAWGASGPVTDGQILQVKGRPYSLAELLGGDGEAARFEGGQSVTLYLSPKDYHRFHAPADAVVDRALHVPGSLWPVNRAGVLGIDGLFARNERIVLSGRLASGEALAYVAVGATMVGKTQLAFTDLETNIRGASRRERRFEPSHALAKGDEVGRFKFGSTLVLVFGPGVAINAQPPGTPVRLGERIGRLPV